MGQRKRRTPVWRETFLCRNGQLGFRTGVFDDHKKDGGAQCFELCVNNEAGPNDRLHRRLPGKPSGIGRCLLRKEYAVVQAYDHETKRTYWYPERAFRINTEHENAFPHFAYLADMEEFLCSTEEKALEKQEALKHRDL